MFPLWKQSNLVLQKSHFSVVLQYFEFYRMNTRKDEEEGLEGGGVEFLTRPTRLKRNQEDEETY